MSPHSGQELKFSPSLILRFIDLQRREGQETEIAGMLFIVVWYNKRILKVGPIFVGKSPASQGGGIKQGIRLESCSCNKPRTNPTMEPSLFVLKGK